MFSKEEIMRISPLELIYKNMRSIESIRNHLLQKEKELRIAENMDLALSSGGYEVRRVRQQLGRSIKKLKNEADRLRIELLECDKNVKITQPEANK